MQFTFWFFLADFYVQISKKSLILQKSKNLLVARPSFEDDQPDGTTADDNVNTLNV